MSVVNYLPPELIEAILPLLPAKSLGRFKSVSKQWYSLISSPNFIKTLIVNCNKNNPNPNPTHLILYPRSDDLCNVDSPNYSLDIKQLNTQITPVTLTAKSPILYQPWYSTRVSCNGLLLVYRVSDVLCLVNPTTGKTLKLPNSGGFSYDAYGFGYDSLTDDYKVIFLYRMRVPGSDPDSHFVGVYSLRNNSSSVLPNSSYKHYRYHRQQGLLLNNILHWVVTNTRDFRVTIFAFNLANDEFHEIEIPYSFLSWRHLTNVFNFGEKLVAVLYDHRDFIELWVMEEYGVSKSLTKLCTIKNNIDICFEVFAQVSNREILLGNNRANESFIYNLDERRCTSVTTVKGYPEGFMVSGTYVESLESFERFG
ncbi:F-box/kelch-repeat protein At3g06240-like [Rutidosis leptorrhynchoides]|uniref:F-box/kelch-repeat protein At3g06240-like n=1 Tax=Rutidosis leptorrhynchoides TaxID=125765 RepID=UPI003A994A90